MRRIVLALLLLWACPGTALAGDAWSPSTPAPWEQATVACALLLEADAEGRPGLLDGWVAKARGEVRDQLGGARALVSVRDWALPAAGPRFADYLPVAMSSADYEREETLVAAASGAPVPATDAEWLADVAGARLRVASLRVVRRADAKRSALGAEGPSPAGFAMRSGWDYAVVDHLGEALDTEAVATVLGPPGALGRYRGKKNDLAVAARVLAVVGSSILAASSVGAVLSLGFDQRSPMPAVGMGFGFGSGALGAAAGLLDPLRRLEDPSRSGLFEESELRRLTEARTELLRVRFGAPSPEGQMRKGAAEGEGVEYLEDVDYEAIFDEGGDGGE